MKKLSIVVHGDSGAGKSWLGDSAPGPRLILDIEGGNDFTPSEKVPWDGKGPTPEVGPDQTCIVTVTSFDQIGPIYQWLASGNHPFRSVVFDSLSELQKRCIDSVAGVNAPDQQDWGVILRKMEGLVRSFRDMLNQPAQPLEVCMFVAGSHEKGGKRRPLLQGGLGDTLPYYVAVVGYLFAEVQPSGDICRRLLIIPVGPFEAKDRTDKLFKKYGKTIDNPNVTEMLGVINA